MMSKSEEADLEKQRNVAMIIAVDGNLDRSFCFKLIAVAATLLQNLLLLITKSIHKNQEPWIDFFHFLAGWQIGIEASRPKISLVTKPKLTITRNNVICKL